MKSVLLSFMIFGFAALARAEWVHTTLDSRHADQWVYVTDDSSKADCWVYETGHLKSADKVVYLTSDNYRAKWVYFTDNPEAASPRGCLDKE